MKKNYFLLAASTMMFAACAQTDLVNEVVTEEAPQAIEFEPFANKATRADETAENSTATTKTSFSAHHDNFLVWGYKDTETTKYVFGTANNAGQIVNADGTYTPKKYWDKAATAYEFYAAAPNNTKWTLNANTGDQDDDYFTYADFKLTGTTLPLVVGTAPTNSFESVDDVDLMIASPAKVTSFTNNVALNFNHILSRLNITVTKGTNITNSRTTLEIISISVNNLVCKGTFDESVSTGHRWNVGTTPEDYDVAGVDVSEVEAGKTYYIYQTLIIPQDVTLEELERNGSDVNVTNSEPYIYIHYEIGGEKYEATINLAAAFGAKADDGDATNGVEYQVVSFKEGYQNTLNITIDSDEIKFTPNVFDWDNTSGGTTIE